MVESLKEEWDGNEIFGFQSSKPLLAVLNKFINFFSKFKFSFVCKLKTASYHRTELAECLTHFYLGILRHMNQGLGFAESFTLR